MIDSSSDPFADPGARAWLESFKARLVDLDQAAEAAEPVRRVLDAAAALAPFAAVRDRDLAEIIATPAGETGILRLPRPAPPPYHYERWVREMSTAGVPDLLIECGDAADPAARAIVEHAAPLMAVCLKTHPGPLCAPEVLDPLVAAGLGRLFAVSGEDPGGAIAGVEAAVGAGLDVTVGLVVTQDLLSDLPGTARLLADRLKPRSAELGPGVGRVVLECDAAYATEATRELLALDALSGPLAGAIDLLGRAGFVVEALGPAGFPLCALRRADERHWRRVELPADVDRSAHVYGRTCASCARGPECLGVHRHYHRIHGEAGLEAFAD